MDITALLQHQRILILQLFHCDARHACTNPLIDMGSSHINKMCYCMCPATKHDALLLVSSCILRCTIACVNFHVEGENVLFGIILFSCSVTRTSAFLLRAINCLACVDCLWHGFFALTALFRSRCSVDNAHVVSFNVCRLIVRCGLDE